MRAFFSVISALVQCLGLFGPVVSIEEASSAFITIGVISSQDNAGLSGALPLVVSNVSMEFIFADYSEELSLFRAVHKLRESHVDLILLHDLIPDRRISPTLIDLENANMIKLYRQPEVSQTLEKFKASNTTISRRVTMYKPHCITGETMGRPHWYKIYSRVPEIIAKMIYLQGWKSVYVFHDDSTAHQTRDLVDMLSLNGTMVVLYNVDYMVDIHSILMKLYLQAIKEKPAFNAVLMCKIDCSMRVLKSVNDFDRINEDQTILQLLAKWLVPILSYRDVLSSALTHIADSIKNLAILIIPETHPPTLAMLPKHLHSTMISMSYMLDATNFTERQNGSVKDFFIQGIKEDMIEWEPSSKCTRYLIETLHWTSNGGAFTSVGYAQHDGGVELFDNLYPNAQYGYSGREFVVTTHHYPPFVIRREDGNNSVIYEGAFIDLLLELSRVLNFTFKMIDPPDDKWGSVERTVNGTPIFNGMVGQLQRRECDVAAAPLAILPVRDKVVDFSYPVYHEYTTAVVKKPDPNTKKWKTLINPFKWQVLVAIVMALPVVTLILYLMEKHNPYYSVPENAELREQQGGLHHLYSSFWYMSGALLYQGGVHLPESTTGRTFVSSWWIFCIIVGGIYCGNLIAFLTISKDVLPFNTLKEMAKHKGSYKWGTLGGTNWEIIFTTSQNTIIREVGDAMMEFNKSDDVIFHLKTQAHVDRVEQGGYAFIGDVTTVGLAMSENCDLRKIKEEFLPMKNAFAFQDNSPHTVIFSDQIMKSQEAGLFEIWRRHWWPKESICITGTKPEATPITLLDVQSAFYVCLIGWFLGHIVFFLEVLYHKIQQRGRKPKTEEH